MIPLKELLAQVPQSGEVRWIGVRPASRAPMVEIDAVEARRDAGLTGDHDRPTPREQRQVNLMHSEHSSCAHNSC